MLRDLPPRHFADATVPIRPDGTPLNRTASDADYQTYVVWLADHLVTADLPLHPRQLAYATATDAQSPETAAFWISEHFGYAVWEIGSLENHFANGGTWESWEQEARVSWQDMPAEVRAEQTFGEFCLGRERYAQLREEWDEEQRHALVATHADIPYRALLARILRRVPDREERIRMLEFYFRNFSENASK